MKITKWQDEVLAVGRQFTVSSVEAAATAVGAKLGSFYPGQAAGPGPQPQHWVKGGARSVLTTKNDGDQPSSPAHAKKSSLSFRLCRALCCTLSRSHLFAQPRAQ
jgi:hypothetical protein